MRRFIVTVAAVGLLTVGTAGVAAAQTAGAGSSSPTTQGSGSTSPKATGPHRKGAGLVQVTAKTLGVQPRDVVAGLCGGQTIAQLASQHGKSPQDVISSLVKAANARIDQAVKAGKLDASKATRRKSKVEAAVTTRVNSFKPSAARCQKLQGAGTGPGTPSST